MGKFVNEGNTLEPQEIFSKHQLHSFSSPHVVTDFDRVLSQWRSLWISLMIGNRKKYPLMHLGTRYMLCQKVICKMNLEYFITIYFKKDIELILRIFLSDINCERLCMGHWIYVYIVFPGISAK